MLSPVTPPIRKLDLQYILTPESTREPSCDPNPYEEINREQQQLFNDPRVAHQLAWLKRIQHTQPPTFYSALASIGIHILENGTPASQAESKSSDFLSGTCEDLENWLINGTGDKLFLLRDPQWIRTRPETTGSTVLRELQAISDKELLLEVQQLGKLLVPETNSVQPMPIGNVIEHFASSDQSQAPINLLSPMCKDDGTVPWPLAKHCNLLNQAAASASSAVQSRFYATAGKQSSDVISKFVDLESCMHFQILGQAGAISTWHMDSIGPYTYITLEPNYKGQPADHVLKLWAYVRTDNLSEEEQEEIKMQFRRDGGAFQPKPEHIRIISLVAGDTLIMPPGTIHAPITITDCLFRGGMVMQKKEMRRSMRSWRFCAENGRCTNENQPRQSRSILDFFRSQVRADPVSCGYGVENGVVQFEEDRRKISGNSMICGCKQNCRRGKCGCASNTQRCGNRCHRGVAKCDNPYGCEADVALK